MDHSCVHNSGIAKNKKLMMKFRFMKNLWYVIRSRQVFFLNRKHCEFTEKNIRINSNDPDLR